MLTCKIIKNRLIALGLSVALAMVTINIMPYSSFAGTSVQKRQADLRSYHALTLENGLSVMLISDKDAPKAAAALSVQVGSFNDPSDVLGMAHFTEHMLFLGTKKYPNPSDYASFISLHNGSTNAFTSSHTTSYFFDIDNKYFAKALDRFSQFFINPNFNADLVERELNAIHSEHSVNLGNDYRKIYETQKLIFKKSSPASRFATGNKETLQGVDGLRDRLIDFYSHHYSSDKMTLSLLSSDSIDQLKDLAHEYFSDISRKKVPSPKWLNDDAFNRDNLASLLSVKTIKNNRQLILNFPLPSLWNLYQEKSTSYVADLLGEESSGSLLDFLKKEGLATSLGAGIYQNQAYSMLSISIGLTERAKDEIDQIINYFFQYVAHIKKIGPQKWRFDQLKKIGKINFESTPKEDPGNYVLSIATRLHRYPADQVLVGPYYYYDYNPKLIDEILAKTTPSNMFATYAASEVVGASTEKWYGTSYNLEKYPLPKLAKFVSYNNKVTFELPSPNRFLATNERALAKLANQPEKPIKLVENDKLDFWFFNEQTIDGKNAALNIRVMSPIANQTPQDAIMSEILIAAWLEKINPSLYAAEVVGLDYSVSPANQGIDINLFGLKESIYPLLEEVISGLSDFSIEPKIFAKHKKLLQERLNNIALNKPLDRAIIALSFIRKKPSFHYTSKQKALASVNLELTNEFNKKFFAKTKIIAYLHGNYPTDKAKSISDLIVAKIKSSPALPDKLIENKISDISPGTKTLILPSLNNDSALVMLLQSDKRTLKGVANSWVLNSFLQEPFYTQIRTLEQIGYIASVSGFSDRWVPYLAFIVQSPDKSPAQIDQRVWDFNEKYTTKLKSISDKQWQSTKQSLIDEITEYPKTIIKLSSQFWYDILQNNLDFKRNLIVLPALKKLTKPDVLAFWQQMINNAHKKQLNIWVVGKKQLKSKIDTKEKVDDVIKFKKDLPSLSQFPISS